MSGVGARTHRFAAGLQYLGLKDQTLKSPYTSTATNCDHFMHFLQQFSCQPIRSKTASNSMTFVSNIEVSLLWPVMADYRPLQSPRQK